MQLDFFARLMQRFRPVSAPAAAPAPAEVPVSEKSVARTRIAPEPEASWLSAAEELRRAREVLRRAGAAALAERVVVRWNPRMRSTAGTANWVKCLVSLNPQLRQFGPEEVERTLLHELAHLLAQERAGRRRISPHGPEWRRACIDLGLRDEKRCHDLPLTQRQHARRYRYRCPACGVEVRRVRPMRRRTACLACCRRHNRGRYDDRFRFVVTEG